MWNRERSLTRKHTLILDSYPCHFNIKPIVFETIYTLQTIQFSLSEGRKGLHFLQVIADVNHSYVCEREGPLSFFPASKASGQLPINHEEPRRIITAVQLPTLSQPLSQSTSFLVFSVITVGPYPVG